MGLYYCKSIIGTPNICKSIFSTPKTKLRVTPLLHNLNGWTFNSNKLIGVIQLEHRNIETISMTDMIILIHQKMFITVHHLNSIVDLFQKHWDEERRRNSSYFQPMMKNVKGILKEFVINKLIKGSTIVTGIFDALKVQNFQSTFN